MLRDGRTVASGAARSATPRELSELMVGRALGELFVREQRIPGDTVLSTDALSGEPLPESATLALQRGEVLGIAGLVGAGQTELLRTLFGLVKSSGGRISVGGTADGGAPPWTRLGQGLGLLSSDRAREGVALAMSVADNVFLSHLEQVSPSASSTATNGRLVPGSGSTRSAFAAPAGQPTYSQLSGGSQQKVALARLLDQRLDVLLLDEPTRGIDVGSRAEIYRLIDALAREGKAILVVSSYLPELLGLSDRIAVMHRGRLLPARPVTDFTEASLLEATTSGVYS